MCLVPSWGSLFIFVEICLCFKITSEYKNSLQTKQNISSSHTFYKPGGFNTFNPHDLSDHVPQSPINKPEVSIGYIIFIRQFKVFCKIIILQLIFISSFQTITKFLIFISICNYYYYLTLLQTIMPLSQII